MDTAQRGMGLDWPTSLELIRRSLDARATCPARCRQRRGTDHLAPDAATTVDDVIRAYEEQMERDRGAGRPHHPDGSRALARVAAKSPTTTSACTTASCRR
jgi:hypothetical protein